MARAGYRFLFHGAFGSLRAAQQKERRTRGAFIRVAEIRGNRRWMVLSRKRVSRRRR